MVSGACVMCVICHPVILRASSQRHIQERFAGELRRLPQKKATPAHQIQKKVFGQHMPSPATSVEAVPDAVQDEITGCEKITEAKIAKWTAEKRPY